MIGAFDAQLCFSGLFKCLVLKLKNAFPILLDRYDELKVYMGNSGLTNPFFDILNNTFHFKQNEIFETSPEDFLNSLTYQNPGDQEMALAFLDAARQNLRETFGDLVEAGDLSFMLSGSNLPASRAINPNLKYLSQKAKLSVSPLIFRAIS